MAEMGAAEKWVTTTDALVAAIKDTSIRRVVVSGRLTGAPCLRLAAGQSLSGAAADSAIAPDQTFVISTRTMTLSDQTRA